MSNYQKDGCLVCENFPYLDSTGMCAACTFGSSEAQIEMLNGEMEGTVWEREKVSSICGFKIRDRDIAIKVLNKMGVDFKEYNNGMQLNIKTKQGLVSYYPTTLKVCYNKVTSKLRGINTEHHGDIVELIKKLGFDSN